MATFENIFPTVSGKCDELHDFLLLVAFCAIVVGSSPSWRTASGKRFLRLLLRLGI